MNLPDLVGYFRYPTLAHNQTQSYFAAFPPLMPIVAVIDILGTNPFLSATAIFDGQSVPVVVLANRLTAQIKAKLSDIGRLMDLQWTLRFAENPTVITYIHRILVIGNDSTIDPIPTLTGNPCNIPCHSQVINATGYSTPLYFATSGATTSYEGFGFVSNQISNGTLLNWCQVNAAGFINVPPYTLPTFTGTPNWVERSRVCAQEPPRTSSDAFVFEVDENNVSPTFGRARQRTVSDPTLCPLGNTVPDWEDDGLPYCQPEPRDNCRKLQDQIDLNPISPTFNTRRTITLPPTPTDCEDCPPTSLLPDYQDTGEWRCAQPHPIGRDSDVAEKRQIDRNPYSPTYNQDIWVSIGPRPDLCPIDPNPCNREVWIDSKTPDCELITRCKFDPPRYESTRQKQQVQVNPALPNVGAIRWVDLPPSPEDATLCPVQTCPIYVPVCPEQIRCKFEPPRISAMQEKLFVDVNPNSATVGQQVWQDFNINHNVCPTGAWYTTAIGWTHSQVFLATFPVGVGYTWFPIANSYYAYGNESDPDEVPTNWIQWSNTYEAKTFSRPSGINPARIVWYKAVLNEGLPNEITLLGRNSDTDRPGLARVGTVVEGRPVGQPNHFIDLGGGNIGYYIRLIYYNPEPTVITWTHQGVPQSLTITTPVSYYILPNVPDNGTIVRAIQLGRIRISEILVIW